MYAEIWSARNDPSVKTLVYEALIADGPNGYTDHLPVIADFLGLNKNEEEDNGENTITVELYEKIAFLVSRTEMVRHVDKFDDHFIADMGKKYGRALRIMEPAAKVRKSGNRVELTENTLEWLEDQWLERMTPVTGHTSYDEFASDLSDLLFANVVEMEDEEKETTSELGQQQRQSRKSSIVMRRQSRIVIQQMPGIRRRRESLAPHE